MCQGSTSRLGRTFLLDPSSRGSGGETKRLLLYFWVSLIYTGSNVCSLFAVGSRLSLGEREVGSVRKGFVFESSLTGLEVNDSVLPDCQRSPCASFKPTYSFM